MRKERFYAVGCVKIVGRPRVPHFCSHERPESENNRQQNDIFVSRSVLASKRIQFSGELESALNVRDR